MALSFVHNALQVNFESVISLPSGGMLKVFQALESSNLRGFLGCSATIYEEDIQVFFANAKCRMTMWSTQWEEPRWLLQKICLLSHFSFQLKQVAVTDLPVRKVNLVKLEFSNSRVPVKSYCKKKSMKVEYRLLNDIVTKTLTSKAGSFDAVTQEWFDMMVAIMGGIKLNWSSLILEVCKAYRWENRRPFPPSRSY
ncbi:hypothetical protein F511_40376 [Dorcoceras hygrometricum]|uniref:Uncharacterized protein n=1 Tax=Dorcoceras hygrometricum TaxID=472368 RepID=A0A2Z7CYP8_9LAMI|nr:hypothetical protein F511_40376 [Dorcoceras hygrometricum]